ncbi:hypothetical protein ACHAO1_000562 [Botrytis cinerea]
MKKPRERASNLRALLSGTEMPKTWKLISSPPDVVTTAILCAAARRTGGFSLSPLEERWLGVLSSFASDDEITQWGQIYMGNKETARFIDDKSILAVSVLQINNNKPDATKMLIKNAFAVMPELFTKPENTDVDISKFTNQDHSNNPKYTMAVVQSNTIVISFTNIGLRWEKKTGWTKGKFGSVDTGTVHHLNDVYLFEGPIQTNALTTRCEYRACHLEIWEYDSSGTASFAQMSDIMKNAAQEYIDAAIEANDNQDQWDESASEGITLLALIGFIAHAFSFLINLAINEDDHVQNRNSIFGKAALVNFTKPHPPNETSFVFQREGKAGGFEVWIKFYPLAGPTGTLQTATLYSERLADPPQTVSG